MSRYDDLPQSGKSAGFPFVETGLLLLGGLAVGAGVMYLLDPEEGPTRRSSLRKTADSALDAASEYLSSTGHSVADHVDALRQHVSSIQETAHDLTNHVTTSARSLIEQAPKVEDDSMGLTSILSMVVGGGALAAVIYLLTTEFDSIRKGDFAGAATNAYSKASNAVHNSAETLRETATQFAGRTAEYFTGQTEQTDDAPQG